MSKTIFIIKELNDMYRIIEYKNGKRDENIKNQNEMKASLYQYDHNDMIIHDIPLILFKPSESKTRAYMINVIEAFGCDWNSFFTQFSIDDFINAKIDKFSRYDLEIPESNPIHSFYQELQSEFSSKSFFGSAADYHQYTFNVDNFYKFLSKQPFPNPKHLSLKEYIVDTMKPDTYARFILALHMYEGFAVCKSLITDDIQLDELNIFEKSNEIIIPFNILKYIIKSAEKNSGQNMKRGINELHITKFYVTTKKIPNFNNDLNSLEKMITLGGFCERSDIFTKMYVRYYFFIYALKYFKEDIISIDLKRKIIHTYNKNIESSLFHSIK